jgi:hypothetical protein
MTLIDIMERIKESAGMQLYSVYITNVGCNTAFPRQQGIQLHMPAAFNPCTHGNNGQVGTYCGQSRNDIGNQFSNFQTPTRYVCVQHSFIFC